jgi:hypothetical protein
VVSDPEADDRREPECAGEAKRVKKGQYADHHIAGGQLKQRSYRLDVGEDVSVR